MKILCICSSKTPGPKFSSASLHGYPLSRSCIFQDFPIGCQLKILKCQKTCPIDKKGNSLYPLHIIVNNVLIKFLWDVAKTMREVALEFSAPKKYKLKNFKNVDSSFPQNLAWIHGAVFEKPELMHRRTTDAHTTIATHLCKYKQS